jgi:ParB family chromosome partitioning protein
LLVCGRRRLEAVKRLGRRTVRVWVRVGISDDLARLVAEQDENATHKPLSPIEAARLFREMRELMREDAACRQHATRFGAPAAGSAGVGSSRALSSAPERCRSTAASAGRGLADQRARVTGRGRER